MPQRASSMRSAITTVVITILITAFITFAMMAMSGLSGGFAAPQAMAIEGHITWPIIIHLATVLPALLLGPFILLRKKGDASHRMLGRIWAVLMLITAIASAFIRAPGGGILGTGYSAIHIFTIWTLVNVPLGVWFVRKGQVAQHRGIMTGLYIGLCVAGAFTLIPGRLLGNLVFG